MRTTHADEELRSISGHLYYEIDMLLGIARALERCVYDNPRIHPEFQQVIHNALLESFVVHARIMIDFLYSDHRKPNRVYAGDFFDASDVWKNKRSQRPVWWDKLNERVGQEVAHLTYARKTLAEETKQWSFMEIAMLIHNEGFIRFLELVPAERLGPELLEAKDLVLRRANSK